MPARKPIHVLMGVTAGLTVTALFGATQTVPATAAPVDVSSKFKAADASFASRVVKDRYLVQTGGTPLVRGGHRSTNKASLAKATATADAAGATVQSSFSDLWTGFSVTANDDQINTIAESSSVTAIYPVLTVAQPRTDLSSSAATNAINEVAADDTGYTGQGIKVGVIDTGIDYNNVDLGGSGTQGNNADFGTAAPRVKYGTDLVGDNYDADDASPVLAPDAYPDDCAGHGTHVAGIIGAQGTGDGATVKGVAPGVTFGAYRIFGCGEDSTSATDVIIDAMSRAQADGMDVVNMSLGSTFDSWPSYPEAVAAKNLTLAGVVLVVSAGNSGSAGLFAAGTPAVGEGVISVASYETATVRGKALGVGTDKFLYTQIIGAATVPEDSSTLSLRAASNTTACKKPSKVPAGTALLVRYGPCYVWQQMANAEAAGASAVVLYNNKSSLVQFTMGSTHTSALPGAGISGAKGSALAASLKKSKVLTLGMLGLTNDVTNPDGSRISTFSSAGLSADLRLVPTISAPGGKIYSTLPIELGGHGTMSGTSMAAPFVAGTAALLLEARPTLKGHPADVAQLLYNTATPVSKATESGVTKYPEAVFRQGSGLVKAASAIAASVTASPSVLQLGDGTSDTRTITLTNNGTQTLTYTPTRISGVSAAASTGSATHVGTTTPSYAYGQVGFTTDKATVTLDPGASADVTVTLTAPAKALKGKAGMLYGGWVQFTTTGDGNTVSVPFVGLRGDYQSVKLLNKFRYVDSKGKKYSWPQLGFEDSDGEIYYGVSQKSGKWAVDFDIAFPAVFYHLDYPASDLRLKVIDLTAKTSSWAILDSTTGTAEERTHWGRMSRDAAAQWVTFRGESWSSGDTTTFATDGHAYQLQLKVLKPLGDPDKSSDWESYTSPKFWYLSE